MKRQNLGLFATGLTLTLLVSACATPSTPAPTPGPLDQIKTFETLYAKRDIEGALTLFADNSTWNWVFTVSAKKGVRNVFEYASRLNAQWKFTDCQLAGDVATCKAVYTDDCMPPELTGYHSDMKFKFTDGKISSAAGSVDSAEWSLAQKYFPKWQSWGQKNLPEDFAVLSVPGVWNQFSGNGEASSKLTPIEFGQAIDRMCKGYASAAK